MQDSEFRSQFLSAVKWYRDANKVKNFACFKENLRLSNEDVDSAKNIDNEPWDIFSTSIHINKFKAIFMYTERVCTKDEVQSMKKWLELEDSFLRTKNEIERTAMLTNCFKLKLSSVLTDSSLLENFDGNAITVNAEACKTEIDSSCDREKSKSHIDKLFKDYNLTSCAPADFYPGELECISKLRNFIARHDQTLSNNLRITELIDFQIKHKKDRSTLLECIAVDNLAVQ
jgi:hypothetical protein